MVAPFFVLKIGEDQKKGRRCKTSGVLVQKYVKTQKKKKGLCLKISWFLVQMRMGTTKQSKKSKVFTTNGWSYDFTSYNMVSPKNGDTRGGRDATNEMACQIQ